MLRRYHLPGSAGAVPPILTAIAAAVSGQYSNVFSEQVYQRCQPLHDMPLTPRVVPYFTDASLLLPALGNPPCIILGPGEPSMAHQTDEYCLLSRLEEAERLYGELIGDWMA